MRQRMIGKVIIITGAAGVLGSAGARLLAREGASVVLNDISSGVNDLQKELRDEGLEVAAHVGSVSDAVDVAAMIRVAIDAFGRVDALWNNAGPVSNDFIRQDTQAMDISVEFLMKTLNGHVGSALLCSQHAIPAMIKSGGGSIINTSSAAAFGGDLVLAAYSIAKMAMITLTQNIATAYGHNNIRCNAVAPGLIPGRSSDVMAAAAIRMVRDSQMLDRHGEPDDIANAVLYLASDESKFFTGQVMCVDGGLTGHQPMLASRRQH